MMPLMITLAILIMAAGCSGGSMAETDPNLPTVKNIRTEAWTKLEHTPVFFGHQSVGLNILEGVGKVLADEPVVHLRIQETSDPAQIGPGILAHARIGKNTDPRGKTAAFGQLLDAGIGAGGGIAFHKFCYVDITQETDVDRLFSEYRTAMARLRERFPGLVIVHVTVPLTRTETTFTTRLKRLAGRIPWEYRDNIQRHRFNEMLRREYQGKEPLFDLARLEATWPDGRRNTISVDGTTFETLVPEFTEDGGHLAGEGQKQIARQLLIFLARLADSRP